MGPGGVFDVVTGAFGQSGHAIAQGLLQQGREVRTITRAPSIGGPLRVIPPTFLDPDRLTEALRGCEVLYSTYWARYGVGGRFEPLVEDARRLYACARQAGVRRIVQVTVANPAAGQGIPYFDGKTLLEAALRGSGVPHSILRPALLFGPDDTLVQNAAWVMRHLHVLPLPGGGTSPLRPAFVGDLATMAIRHGALEGNRLEDVSGPERYTFRGLFEAVRAAIGVRCALVPVPWALAWAPARVVGAFLGDSPLTRSEATALRRGLFDLDGPATCPTRFSAWLRANAETVGRSYHAQRKRHRGASYPHLHAP